MQSTNLKKMYTAYEFYNFILVKHKTNPSDLRIDFI